jgi:suppressor of ftsI
MCFAMLGSMRSAAQVVAAPSHIATPPLLSDPPEARSPIVLTAINDSHTGKAAFTFQGREDPPVIRANPGEDSPDICERNVGGLAGKINFHGLHVSPDVPQDDVITMMAMLGQSLHYVVNIPLNQPPGLYWYHSHPHGESYQQYLDGMSGVIVIDGIERYVLELKHMRERVLVLRDRVIGKDDPAASELKRKVFPSLWHQL